jgi:hypothetical protein
MMTKKLLLILILAVTGQLFAQLQVQSESSGTLLMRVENSGDPANPAIMTVKGKTVTDLLQLKTNATSEYVIVATDDQGTAQWGQVTTTSIQDQTIVKEDLSFYGPIIEFRADAAHSGAPFQFTDTNMNQSSGRSEVMGDPVTLEPGVYFFSYVAGISFDREGSWEYYPSGWMRLYKSDISGNVDWSKHYCAIHALSGDSDSAGEHSGSNIHEFTETTTIVPVISAQEGTSTVWNGNGLVAKAIRLF